MNSEQRLKEDKVPLQSVGGKISSTSEESDKSPWHTKYIGLMFCFAFTIAMALTSTVVKLLHLPATEKVFVRCLTQFLLLLPLISYAEHQKKYTVFISNKRTLFMLTFRGISSSAASLLLYHALQRIAIGDATAITFCSAIFAGLFARIFLKEAYTFLDAVFAVVALSGVCMIAQPEFLLGKKRYDSEQLLGMVFALCAAVTIGSSMTVIRGLAKVEPWVGVFYYCTFGALLNGVVFYFEGNYALPCSSQLHLFFGVGVLGTTSQFLVTKSLQYERPSTVAVMRSIEIILVYIIQVLLFKDIPNMYSIIGAGLIFISALGIGLRKYLKQTPANPPTVVELQECSKDD